MSIWGHVYFRGLLEGCLHHLEVSERDVEGSSGWSRVGDFKLGIEFTLGQKKDAALREYISGAFERLRHPVL